MIRTASKIYAEKNNDSTVLTTSSNLSNYLIGDGDTNISSHGLFNSLMITDSSGRATSLPIEPNSILSTNYLGNLVWVRR